MSTKYVTVKVTRKHIAAGKPSHACECPIALALKDKGFSSVEVWRHGWYPEPSTGGCAMLSKKALDFVDLFDNERPVKPATFRLPLPVS